jgi:arsenical pump membrane protein
MRLAGGTIGAMLVGIVAGASLGLPVWPFPAGAAAILFALLRRRRPEATQALVQSVAWDVVLVMAGFFLMVRGIQATPLAELLAGGIQTVAGTEPIRLVFTVGALAAAAAALMNNHPAAYLLSGSLDTLAGDAQLQQLAAFALLIGGDLGPKLLPIGSLAALLWLRILRDHGVPVTLATYVRIGVPVTLVALVGALLTLAAEAYWMGLGP